MLLTACGGSTSVADPPVFSPSASSAPPPPKRETPEQFIRRWAAEDVRVQHTGRTKAFREMSDGCGGCAKLVQLVEHIYAHGGYIHGGNWRVQAIDRVGTRLYDMHVELRPTTINESESGPIQRLPGGPATFRLRLAPRPTSWVVRSLVQVAA
jgi:hypothetical protein